MLKFPNKDKLIVLFLSAIFFVLLGFGFGGIHQPDKKAINIYKQALRDYKNKDYQNSYYLFSKIGSSSGLKPFALYHQSMCANAIQDEKTELEVYEIFLEKYPNNPLSENVKYKAGQILIKNNPQKAEKIFKDLADNAKDIDIKTASDFHLSKIKSENYNTKDFESINKGFRNYLQKYPKGRLAYEVAKSWQKYNISLASSDYLLIAKAFYDADKIQEAQDILSKVEEQNSWALRALIAKKYGHNQEMYDYIAQGVSSYPAGVPEEDYNQAVMEYLKTREDLYNTSSKLFNIAKGKNKDYLWTLKCKYSPNSEKLKCYNELYSNYPNSKYTDSIVSNLLLQKVINKDYKDANEIASDFILKYPNSESVAQIMFWQAKIQQNYIKNPNYNSYYNKIINKFPDSYYAYRSFWITQGLKSSVLNENLEYKPVQYPYKDITKDNIPSILITVEDYELISILAKDLFIKSWAQYKNGEYISSLYSAKSGMEKLKSKPSKNDLRWRLVYPLYYFDNVKSSAQTYKNNEALIMALIKEESSFNPEIESGAGAVGLMQLMPQTAQYIADINNYYYTPEELINPEYNIKLGNMYYSYIKNQLNNMDISAVASYNGGIGAVTKWKNNITYNDTDEFVEQIPYEETKSYVKKVFRSYWNYMRIYQR